jgi:hypothetical protein
LARIRSVKPELRDSQLVASWPFEVRYFWVLLFGYLDDSGRGKDMPKRIAGDCFPHDDIDATEIDEWLDLMTRGVAGSPGPVCRYEVAGNRYLHAVNWTEHQKPNRPTPSRLPRCPIHEGLSESPLSDSRDRAEEQRSRGAEEQQQAARESLTATTPDPPPHILDAATLVVDAAGCDLDHAIAAVTAIARKRKPKKLPAYVRTLIDRGGVAEWLQQTQASPAPPPSTGDARAGPDCPHQMPGGLDPLASTGKPRCPQCRQIGDGK